MAKQQIKKTTPTPAQNNKAVKQNKAGPEKKFPIKLEIASLPWLTPYIPGILLLLICLFISLSTYKDYGVSWDEPIQRYVGLFNYEFIFNHGQPLKTFEFRGLGTGFELPLIFMEKWAHLENSADIYFARHLATNIFFLFSVFCGYILAYRLFKDKLIASLAFILLIFQPRIYAHSFFNSKDVPLLAAFLIAMLLCQVAFEKNKPFWYLLLGLACGYATSIRAIGILLILCISVFFLIDFFRSLALKEKILPVIRNFFIFILGFSVLLYVAWPILWSNPIYYFIESFHNLATIVWDGRVLFNGKQYNGNMLPWNYTLIWFSITMPELWLITGIVGFVWVIVSFCKKPLNFIFNAPERNYLLYIACFLGPAIAMTVFHGANIDDWRHIYFIYPSFVMLVLYGINKLATGKKKSIIAILCALQIGYTGFFMVKYHPFQQVYFNNLVSHAPEYLRRNYDMEYWGCSFKQGLDYILANDPRPVIKVNCDYVALFNNNSLLIPDEERRRLQYTELQNADYIITNFRFHNYDYPSYKVEYSISVLNSTLLCVFKQEKDIARKKQLFGEEIAILNKALANDPNDFKAHERLAMLYNDNMRFDSAEYHLNRATQLTPNNIDPLESLAALYLIEKKYPESIEILRKIIALKPEEGSAHMRIGDAFFNIGQYDSSEVHDKIAIALNPNNSDAFNNLAGVYFFGKKYREAIDIYKKAIELRPDFVNPYTNIGACYFYLNKYDSAIIYLNKSLNINKNYSPSYQILVATYKAMGKADSARFYEDLGHTAIK